MSAFVHGTPGRKDKAIMLQSRDFWALRHRIDRPVKVSEKTNPAPGTPGGAKGCMTAGRQTDRKGIFMKTQKLSEIKPGSHLLSALLKRAIVTAFCHGLLTFRATQRLIDLLGLKEA